MKRTLLLLIILVPALFTPAHSFAQNVKGRVLYKDVNQSVPLELASVYWVGGKELTMTKADGSFSIKMPEKGGLLVASYVGYRNDTLKVLDNKQPIEFLLVLDNQITAARVMGRSQGTIFSKTAPVKSEIITASGLCKMACCNLAESFENSASVTVGYSDAISGARQIKLLGLSGAYTQMLEESQPTLRGMLSTFGLNYVPGQWLESIQVSKGTGSVLKGYESITGQINMEYRKPTAELPLFVNLFMSNHFRTEANVASSLQLNDRWSTVILAHYSTALKDEDMNHDGFMDDPLTTQYNFANRWLYQARNGIQVRFGYRGIYEDRESGQIDYDRDKGPSFEGWGSKINNKGISSYLKVGIPLAPDDDQKAAENPNWVRPNIAFVMDYTHHSYDSWFGMTTYKGQQNNWYGSANLAVSAGYHHKYTLGISASVDDYNESLSQCWQTGEKQFIDPSRREAVCGIFGEYTFTIEDRLTIMAGLREDHNSMYGNLFTPKFNAKLNIGEKIVFRASAGKGYRSANIIADNIGMLSTSRFVKIDSQKNDNKLDLEKAWTYGLNLSYNFHLGNGGDDAVLSFDYFRTDFSSQVVMDQELESGFVHLYNVTDKAYTNTYQVDFSVNPFKGFTAMLTYRYNESKVYLKGQGLVERPLTSRYKGVLNLQYATNLKKWIFDFTAQLNGPAVIPCLSGNMAEMTGRKKELSDVYPMYFLQVTKKFKGVDVYIGAENLLNYKQKNPIISAESPYSKDFNASIIWGPLMGFTAHAGVRISVWKR